MDSTNPMTEIKTAEVKRLLQRSSENFGSVSGGKPCGTAPTILTPKLCRSSNHTRAVVTTIAATGPVLAIIFAIGSDRPSANKTGSNPLRTQNRKTVVRLPMSAVIQLMSCRCAQRDSANCSKLCPSASMPKIAFSWLAAMIRPEAVIKPAMTGCDRKLAMNPKRNIPIATKNTPDKKARAMAAKI